MRALDIITDAYERLNRFSPGETMGDDEAAFAFRRLNLLVDELSARGQFLFRDVTTTVTQTGHITLAAGYWAAVPAGASIVSMTQAGSPVSRLDMEQYLLIPDRTTTGAPGWYAHDGLSAVYLYPVASGQSIVMQTRAGVTAFADQTTTYTAAPGWAAALGAGLAVRLAPPVLGKLPLELVKAETAAMQGVMRLTPPILDTGRITGTRGRQYDIRLGW